MKEKIYIDGSFGEGGGQVLRTALSLSMITGKSLEIANIRAGRKKPGLLRQHLTCVKASAEICDAHISGAELGSQRLVFIPDKIKAGNYSFKIGSAGSAMLVFQTILPALMLLEEESKIELEGGTHNPMAPPFHFITESFLPQLKKMGVSITANLDRWGFYPVGGGKVNFTIKGKNQLSPLFLKDKGNEVSKSIVAFSSNLIPEITEAEASYLKDKLDWDDISTKIDCNSLGPGNVIMAEIEHKNIKAVFCEFGEKGLRAAKVAQKLLKRIKKFSASFTPVEEYLADQLLLPIALAGRGEFNCNCLSMHTKTNIEIIKSFLYLDIVVQKNEDESFNVKVGD